ncbi:ABC transporter permease [Pontibaca salina]|uniref:ABC transporter permease n=1 Tax=Pontibaca salina TaxID=2795731 RepID=A0A934HKU2_9RHOB|nr:ABC transporter permease [Pontibaca salina]MBI6629943.1 ABC transporter permease [Pontibaca salina]
MTDATLLLETASARTNPRRTARRRATFAFSLLLSIVVAAAALPESWLSVDPFARRLAPGLLHPFGTDLLGRDVAARTLTALSNSISIGIMAALASTTVAVALSLAATLNPWLDRLVGILTELTLGLPHFVLILMIAYAFGGGWTGVVIGVAFTHWPRLSRVLRLEAQTVAQSDYVAISAALGRSRLWIAQHHLAPHLVPQIIAGFVLIFPHAILHEAGLSFIGLGIEPHIPSIGVMLAESLRAVMSGLWWVAVFPGLGLVIVALSFEFLGESLRQVSNPTEGVA